MARYLLTSIPPRTELIPTHDTTDSLDGHAHALLDESERRRLQSYRPPTGPDMCVEPTATELLGVGIGVPEVGHTTGRWTAEERDALLALTRASIEPDEAASNATVLGRMTPPPRQTRRVTIRRGPTEVVMADVRRRLREAG